MTKKILLDNDIVLKACCYLAGELVIEHLAGEEKRGIFVLGAIRFVLEKRISKSKKISEPHLVSKELEKFLSSVQTLEPTYEEQLLAARFEDKAQKLRVELDGGESQLLAILISRTASLLLTGDKRAIRAAQIVLDDASHSVHVEKRIGCLEQLAMSLVTKFGPGRIQELICRDSAVDISLSNCFSCASGVFELETITGGLESYIGDLRKAAGRLLLQSNDLSPVVP
jgi:predicted nucleic acid-binding protein